MLCEILSGRLDGSSHYAEPARRVNRLPERVPRLPTPQTHLPVACAQRSLWCDRAHGFGSSLRVVHVLAFSAPEPTPTVTLSSTRPGATTNVSAPITRSALGVPHPPSRIPAAARDCAVRSAAACVIRQAPLPSATAPSTPTPNSMTAAIASIIPKPSRARIPRSRGCKNPTARKGRKSRTFRVIRPPMPLHNAAIRVRIL